MDLSFFIKEYIQESSLETEYAGYIKNTHESITLFVKCWIDNNSIGYEKIFEVKPLSEVEIFYHWCGPSIENEYGFKVLAIALEKQSL